MREAAARLLAAQRSGWLRAKPVFEPHAPVNASELEQLERKLGCALPASMRSWLLELGYGDINEELSFRAEWFSLIDRGQLQGHVFFAQDVLGNFYSVGAPDGKVHFICRSASEYALLAQNFRAFVEAVDRRNYQVLEWAQSLPAARYDWGV